MKIRAKNVLLVLVISVFFLSAMYQIALTRAKNALISNLSQLASKKVSIRSIAFRLPATIRIKDLQIGERKDQKYFSIGGASVSLAPFASLRRRQLVFSRIHIIDPKLFYEREEAKKGPLTGSVRGSDPGSAFVGFFSVAQQVDISNGSIEFIDRQLAVKKLGIAVSGLNCSAIVKGRSREARIAEFSVNAGLVLGDSSPECRVSINGWTDLNTRLTRARVELKNIDGIYLYPYYSEWVRFEQARFKQALFDFSADVAGAKNVFDAACRLELTRSEFEPLSQGQAPGKEQKLAMLVIEIFKALDNGRVFLDFNLKYDSDLAGLDWAPLSRAFSEKIKNGFAIRPAEVKDALKLPEHVIKNTVATLGSITKTVLGQTVELGQQLTQTVQDTFIKVAPKKEN